MLKAMIETNLDVDLILQAQYQPGNVIQGALLTHTHASRRNQTTHPTHRWFLNNELPLPPVILLYQAHTTLQCLASQHVLRLLPSVKVTLDVIHRFLYE